MTDAAPTPAAAEPPIVVNRTAFDSFVAARRAPTLLKWVVGHSAQCDDPMIPIDDSNGLVRHKAIAEGIAAENKHIENRVIWNLTLQGFLFASYAIALGAAKIPLAAKQRFVEIVAAVGALSCVVTLLGLYAAYRSINYYKRLWLSHSSALGKFAAPPFSSPWPSFLGRLPSTLMAIVLLGSWWFLLQLPSAMTGADAPDRLVLEVEDAALASPAPPADKARPPSAP